MTPWERIKRLEAVDPTLRQERLDYHRRWREANQERVKAYRKRATRKLKEKLGGRKALREAWRAAQARSRARRKG